MLQRTRLTTRLLATGLAAMLGTSAALAQEEPQGPYREEGIRYVEGGKPYLQWALGVLFIVGCMVLAFKNPHRTHLD